MRTYFKYLDQTGMSLVELMFAIALTAIVALAGAALQGQLAQNQQSNTYADSFNLVISNIAVALNSQRCGPMLSTYPMNPAAISPGDPNGLFKKVPLPGISSYPGGAAVIPADGAIIDGLIYSVSFNSFVAGTPAPPIATYTYVTGQTATQYIVQLAVSAQLNVIPGVTPALIANRIGGKTVYSESFLVPVWVNGSTIVGCNCIMGVVGC